MRATMTMRRNDDLTLTGAAHPRRTIEGVEAVTVDEARSALVVDHDARAIDEGELMNRISAEGIVDVQLRSADEP